ncbi:MAG: hypothetical protein KF878_10930 [Planctomycetes bacterium]|nr:hypothetical protein [Planctomycetota bacterium]
MRVECGWCGELLEPGAGAGDVSHGICDACASRWLEQDDEPGRAGSSSSRRARAQEPKA